MSWGRDKPSRAARRAGPSAPPIGLKALADYLKLSPGTVSVVLNRSPAAAAIPQRTKERIQAAAKKLDYRPNFFARSLRKRRTFTVGVLVPEISEGYAALVMSGIEDYLLQAGYFYFVASHRHRPDLIEEYPKLLLGRAVEGLIAVDTPYQQKLPIPVVTISGHHRVEGVTNLVLNHHRAACLALQHLAGLGHQRIAFIKGQAFSSDTETRWHAICEAMHSLGLPLVPKLTVQLEGDSSSPELGYEVSRRLLASNERFTALFTFNDISAIGAIRALREAGLRIPEDVSVVGFDDIQSAAFQNPGLTTVRQPLRKMGEIAAETVIQRVTASRRSYPKLITVDPELVIRESTGPATAELERG
ncbi:MAG: LacI family transcriptional regulator [Acidobacteria bacterium]|nr:LacI family transcriptional regulator [Acidobacteriota bacterium]